jgi:hypothetical protein
MIFNTPIQSKGLFELVRGSDNPRDWPIRKHYPGFETTFLMFHPFLRIKKGHEDLINFETGNWPLKNEIVEHCDLIKWNQIIMQYKFKDIVSLDRALAFYHCSTKNTDNESYEKLINALKEDSLYPPLVDNFPEILEDKMLYYLKQNGINDLIYYSDINEDEKKITTEELIRANGLTYHVRLENKEKPILIVQDFDQRFSYIFGNQDFLTNLIADLDLEGFYCDDLTLEAWSLIPEIHKIMEWKTRE